MNGGTLHDFDTTSSVDTQQQITLQPGGSIVISLQWDQPFGSLGGSGSASDMDLLVFDSSGNVITSLSSTNNNIGGDAVEITGFTNTTSTAVTYSIGFELVSGPQPGKLKYIAFGGGYSIDEFATNSPTSYGHANAAGAEAVGAAFYNNTPEFGQTPPLLEPFSSAGGIDILFDTNGNRLATPSVRQTPDIVAPDGANTTFFGQDISTDADSFPNFFGTSAAAPHAAAVAALMVEAAGGTGTLSPSVVDSILESTAVDMGIAGFDNDSGFGLVDAFEAVNLAETSGDEPPPPVLGQQPAAGDWGGLVFDSASSGNLDYVKVRYAGGLTPIAGGFASFNPVEIYQADVRISNSKFELNESGVNSQTTNTNRNGRGTNAEATVFIRGAQPTIVTNIFQDNNGNVISVDANSLNSVVNPDLGRATADMSQDPGDPNYNPLFSRPFFGSEENDITTQFANNVGPLVRNNRMENNTTNGMEVRGGILTTEGVWDDVDIVHVVRDEIVVDNLHTYGGLRLESNARESLVVKLSGTNAGFRAAGTIDPVTGLPLEGLDISDRIGGTLQIVGTPGRPVVLTSIGDNTVGAGFKPDGTPLLLTQAGSTGGTPGDWRGIVLDQYSNDRNVAVVNEKERAIGIDNSDPNKIPDNAEFIGTLAPSQAAADDNRRAGFEVHGFINSENSKDQDVYSFTAEAGTEVWFDIDRTAGSLDSVLQLIDINGNVIASSDNSQDEQNNPGLFGGIALPMIKDERLGGDFYTTNPKDAGMRVILPGAFDGQSNTYFIRVRSKGAGGSTSTASDGLSSGEYQLQIRLRQIDEKPGSVVTFSDIRFADVGIQANGLPDHSPLTGEAAERSDDVAGSDTNGSINTADLIGNLLQSDQNALSVAGNLSNPNGDDLDFYQFTIGYADVQEIPGFNLDPSQPTSTIFDIDYADGLARGDTSLYIFNNAGQLILTSTDSNIANDRPGPLQGNDLNDPSRGSVGALDPYIGAQQLPEGTYYAVVTAKANIATALSQFTDPNSVAKLTRLQPVDSITRIAEDHIGTQGGMTAQDPNTLTQLTDISSDGNYDTSDPFLTRPDSSIVPWNLGDVSLVISRDPQLAGDSSELWAVDPYTGAFETRVGTEGRDFRDIDIRRRTDDFSDGNVVALTSLGLDAQTGNFLTMDSGNGSIISSSPDDGTVTLVNGAVPNNGRGVGMIYNAISYTDGTSAGDAFQGDNVTRILAIADRGDDLYDNIVWAFDGDGTQTNSLNPPHPGDRPTNDLSAGNQPYSP